MATPTSARPPQISDETNRTARRDPRLTKLLETMGRAQQRGKISRPVLEAYLEKSGRSARSLLAVWQESGNDAYLLEALEKAPADPAVLLAAALSPALAADHADLLARLQQADPANPLPWWLAAANHFAAQHSDAAFAELLGAEGRNVFNGYQQVMIDEREAMFLASGFDPLRAQIEATFGLPLGYLKPLQQVRDALTSELPKLRSRGENDLAQDLAVTALNLGRAMSDERFFLIDQLVGLSLEKSALTMIGSAEGEGLAGGTVAARLAELEEKRRQIRDLPKTGDVTNADVTYEQFVEYLRRARAEGEMAAMRWLTAQRAHR